MERVRSRQAAKLASVEDRLARARQKVEKEKAEAQNQSLQTYVSIGSAVLGALFGRRKISSTTIGKAATSMRTASRAARQQADVAHAEESLSSLEEKRRLLEDELEAELERIRLEFAPDRLALERVDVPARKTGTMRGEAIPARAIDNCVSNTGSSPRGNKAPNTARSSAGAPRRNTATSSAACAPLGGGSTSKRARRVARPVKRPSRVNAKAMSSFSRPTASV
jgi:hypothetical protein